MAAENTKAPVVRVTGALRLTTPSDREIAMTRAFNAPRRLVFDAITKPNLLKRWLTGPPGWTMPVCEIDLRVGGAYRYEWRGPKGECMGISGIFREIVVPCLVVATEKFDQPWYPGEALVTNSLTEEAGKVILTLTVFYESAAARDVALQFPMDSGVAASYETLAALLPTLETSQEATS